ncbi:MAG: hypothetical protein AABW91_00045 [Nanoarchaeota archaeon]
MQTRREFLRNIVGIGLASALYGCASTNYSNRDDFSKFTHYLGREWDKLPEKKKQETREAWKEADEEGKKLVIDVYKSPKEKYKTLDKNVQNNINSILEYQASGKKIKDSEKYQDVIELSSHVPWINPDNLTKKDLILLGALAEAIAGALAVR